MSGVDDGSIDDQWSLLRRISPEQIVPDQNAGGVRISSAAFTDPAMSVDVEELLVAGGRDWRFSLLGYASYSLVKFAAVVARQHNQAVVHAPLSSNDAHAEVIGTKTRSIARALSKAASWVHRV
jgi:hypothetical protein